MPNNSIVSYRVRLARNLRGYAFPERLSEHDRIHLIGDVAQSVTAAAGGNLFSYQPLDRSTRGLAHALKEQHLISPDFAVTDAAHGVLLNNEKSVSVMLCEEDHLRIQAFGGNLADCLRAAQDVETLIDESHPLAFDEALGFLTACPTNLGTGLRASALMHLPALTETQSMRRLIEQAGSSGLAVRGFYGEGTQAAWGYYQISNSVTMGLSEQEIIEILDGVTAQIAGFEQQAREAMLKSDSAGLSDRVWRALGTLTHARRISTQEAMECLGAVRMGVSLELLPALDTQTIDRLSQEIWPGSLTEAKGPFRGKTSRDEARASLLRDTLEVIS